MPLQVHACVGVRRTARLRQRYLAAALAQDIATYDTTLTAGAVITGLNADCAAVQAATSERVGHTINNLTQFFLGLAIGFVRGWKLSLVMVAVFPVIASAGAIVAKVATAGDAQNAAAYAAANGAAAQAVANIRTVAAFQAEGVLLARYKELLAHPRRMSVRMSVLTGTANGSINASVFLTCAPPSCEIECMLEFLGCAHLESAVSCTALARHVGVCTAPLGNCTRAGSSCTHGQPGGPHGTTYGTEFIGAGLI